MNKNILFLASTFFALTLSQQLHSQSAVDTVSNLYGRYFDLQTRYGDLQGQYDRLTQQYLLLEQTVKSLQDNTSGLADKMHKNKRQFQDVLQSNNESIKRISNAQLFTNQTLLKRNTSRVVSAAEFVEAANVSLNTLGLTKEVFNYTNQVTALNSPTNMELGFSLSKRMQKILDEAIFKKRDKVNKVKRDKFMAVVDGIINAPVVNTITSAVPVVGSIKSVLDLVLKVSLDGDEVSNEDIDKLKKEMAVYLEYYQGLDNARSKFDSKLNSIIVRTEALKLLLRNFTQERVAELYPGQGKQILETPLNQLIADYYNYKMVNYETDKILNSYQQNGVLQYEKAVTDSRLMFPDFAVSQARFIMDEIESISSEYEAALNSYQTEIEEVLKKSKGIGNADKIQEKIKTLHESKVAVTKAIQVSLDVRRLKQAFQALLAVA